MARILVVDDSYVSRKNLKEILTNNGFEIAGEADDGLSAVSKYQDLKPDLVTMDITMPNMNGIDTLKKIMEIDSNAKVIMITSLAQKTKILESLQSGAKGYIAKPFEEDNVLTTIKDVLK